MYGREHVPAGSVMGLVWGVCIFLDNQETSSPCGGGVLVVCFWLGLGFSRLILLIEVFVESLILAQDERWRRA